MALKQLEFQLSTRHFPIPSDNQTRLGNSSLMIFRPSSPSWRPKMDLWLSYLNFSKRHQKPGFKKCERQADGTRMKPSCWCFFCRCILGETWWAIFHGFHMDSIWIPCPWWYCIHAIHHDSSLHQVMSLLWMFFLMPSAFRKRLQKDSWSLSTGWVLSAYN